MKYFNVRVPDAPFLFGTALLVTTVLLQSCGQPERSPGSTLPRAKVQTLKLSSTELLDHEEVPGTLKSRTRATIEAKLSGVIQKMHVTEGQTVEAGQLLAELDAREIRARADQAQALSEQAERDLTRYSGLLQQKAVTTADYESVQSRARVARAAAAEAQAILGYTIISAPFKGVIVRKLSDVGDLAVPGRPVLEIEDPGALRFEASIPESFIKHVRPGAELNVTVRAVEKQFTGTVAEISPVADPGSRTSLIKLDLPPAPELRSGQFGHLDLPLKPYAAIQVPQSAVVRRGQLELVFVIENDRALMRLVRSGRSSAAGVEILSGAEAGETIAISGTDTLKDGQAVQLEQQSHE